MIYNSKSHATQLYNLKADPLAKNNIAKDHDIIIGNLFSKFKEVYGATPNYTITTTKLDENVHEQLKALGYLQ